MRRSYYDNQISSTGRSRTWQPAGPAVPFSDGPVPQSVCFAQESLPQRRRLKKHGHALVGFFLFLLVIAAAAVVTVALRKSIAAPNAEESPFIPAIEHYEGVELQRAPTGDGTVLDISYEQGIYLTPQELYRQLSPSVVAIELASPTGVYSGSGIIISEDGYIITNAHVIENGFRADVWFTDGTSLEALLVGADPQTDLAVLKVDASGLPVAEFGDSAALEVGDTVYAIGNPVRRELRNTMTDGIISALNRDITVSGWEMSLIQTTAAINPGNSGGALVDEYGRVIGITNMKIMSSHDTIEGLGFAIPSSLTKTVVDQLIAYGHCEGRPVLGIIVSNHFDKDGLPAGARIEEVEEKSNAFRAGLKPGDVIIRANGEKIKSIDDLQLVESGMKAGDQLELELWHEGEESRTITVELMEQYQLDE